MAEDSSGNTVTPHPQYNHQHDGDPATTPSFLRKIFGHKKLGDLNGAMTALEKKRKEEQEILDQI